MIQNYVKDALYSLFSSDHDASNETAATETARRSSESWIAYRQLPTSTLLMTREDELEAIIAVRSPAITPDDDSDVDWSIALGTYDYLEIEEGKHATARVTIPWRELDHFAEWRAETEEFAGWWDLWRETNLVVNSSTIVDMVSVGGYLEDPPNMLLSEGKLTAIEEVGHVGLHVP